MDPDPRPYATLFVGDPAPWFRQRSIGQADLFSFDMVAGRFIALCFYGAASDPLARDACVRVQTDGAMFDGATLSFFGVSCAAEDEADASLAPVILPTATARSAGPTAWRHSATCWTSRA